MSKIIRVSLIVVVVILGAAALVWSGFTFWRATTWGMDGFYPGGMMGYSDQDSRFGNVDRFSVSGGNGMMGGFGNLTNADPLSIEETRDAVESYLDSFDNNDLAIAEIMIFDNNAYAIIAEESTSIGAFELLVNPVTRAVFPEYGPNMMWNLKYGMMSSFGGNGMMGGFGNMMGGSGGMMGGFDIDNNITASDELLVSPEEALVAAQSYLDQDFPGSEVSDEITTFYGYYTIDIESDGEITGMVSVNGFTSQVFPHTWHGDFIEMSEG